MPNGKPVYSAILEEYGFTYHGISNKKGTKRPTVKAFSSTETRVCVLRVANHLVASSGGKFFDTWDSGDKSLYGYYLL